MKKEQVLIVGGGFGGVKTALELCRDGRFDVTLLSDSPDFRYYPTLYHAATGGKRANAIIPLKRFFEDDDITLVVGNAKTLDRKAKTVTTAKGEKYEFDTLILALGVITNYFGVPGLAKYSYSIKSGEEVARFKEHLHQQLIDDRRPDLRYVIVGGGPTGIELAGALPAYLKQLMGTHGIRYREVHIDLIEAASRLMPRSPRDVSRMLARRLRHLGVRVHVGKMVQGQTASGLRVNGKPLRSHTVIWTAGVTNHPFFSENDFTITKRGKVAVDTYLQTEENIFVLGDNANTPFSGMAQTAVLDGEFVAGNLKRRIHGRSFKSYTAKEPWTVVPVGKHWALASHGGFRVYGLLGWMLRAAADYVGFHNYEPWQEAGQQWLTELGREETCKVCQTSLAE